MSKPQKALNEKAPLKQAGAKKNLAQIGQPKRGVGVRSTSWREGDGVTVTATTCDTCDGKSYVAKGAAGAPLGYTVKYDSGLAVRVPVCVPCKGLGFVITRQRELGL